MSRCRTVTSVLSIAVLLSTLFINPVKARPRYQKLFEKRYPEIAAKKINCAMCHPGSDKRKHNHYSEALAKELGKKSIEDEKVIMEALRKLEEGECKSGKWGKRIEEGLAPCVCRDFDPPKSVIEHFLECADGTMPCFECVQQSAYCDAQERSSRRYVKHLRENVQTKTTNE